MGAVIVITFWVLGILASSAVGNAKGRPLAGAVTGVLFGLFGVVIMALVPKTREAKIRAAARKREIEIEAATRLAARPDQYARPLEPRDS